MRGRVSMQIGTKLALCQLKSMAIDSSDSSKLSYAEVGVLRASNNTFYRVILLAYWRKWTLHQFLTALTVLSHSLDFVSAPLLFCFAHFSSLVRQAFSRLGLHSFHLSFISWSRLLHNLRGYFRGITRYGIIIAYVAYVNRDK